jgi:RNA polymerase primary sigma factor
MNNRDEVLKSWSDNLHSEKQADDVEQLFGESKRQPSEPKVFAPAADIRPLMRRSGPLLSAEEERRLFRCARSGDAAARDRIIRSHLPLVRRVWSLYRTVPIDDGLSIGLLGLLKAFEHFDPDRGHRFKTQAWKWIAGELKHEIRRRIRTTVSERQAPIILDDVEDGPDDQAIKREEEDARDALLTNALSKLTAREAEIYRGRFLAEPRLPLKELGQRCGVSIERVRQIAVVAETKVRAAISQGVDTPRCVTRERSVVPQPKRFRVGSRIYKIAPPRPSFGLDRAWQPRLVLVAVSSPKPRHHRIPFGIAA